MLPLAIPAVASLAQTALQTWNRVAESQAVAKAQNQVDFQSLLEKTKGVTGAGVIQGALATNNTEVIQKQLGALPEVKAALAASAPGTSVTLEISANNQLSLVSPNGTKQPISLSQESQSALRQLTLPVIPGAAFTISMVSPSRQATV